MNFTRIFLLILISHATISKLRNDFTVYLKLESLKLNFHSDYKCDSPPFSPNCDIYIKVCLGLMHRICDLLNFDTESWILWDKHYTNFDFLEERNPLSKRMEMFPSVLYLYISVFDDDPPVIDVDDFIGSVSRSFGNISTVPFLETSEQFSEIFYDYLRPETIIAQNGPINIKFSLWIECPLNFYGHKCLTHCEPSRGMKNHGCDFRTGDKVCLPGWKGDHCEEVDLCQTQKPCGSFGTCVNENAGFRCICRGSFLDAVCTIPENICEMEHFAVGGSTYCLNGGICVKEQNHTQRCICQAGFTGPRCDQDVDECAHSRSDSVVARHEEVKCFTPGHVACPCCGERAICRNAYGGYQCLCPPGWSGLHCEYPPILWPSGYRPSVNQSIRPHSDRDGAKPWLSEMYSQAIKKANNHLDNNHSWGAAFTITAILLILLLCAILGYVLVVLYRKRMLPVLCRASATEKSSKNIPRSSSPRWYVRPSSIHSEAIELNFTNDIYGTPSQFKFTQQRSVPDGTADEIYEDIHGDCEPMSNATVYDCLLDGDENEEQLRNAFKMVEQSNRTVEKSNQENENP